MDSNNFPIPVLNHYRNIPWTVRVKLQNSVLSGQNYYEYILKIFHQRSTPQYYSLIAGKGQYVARLGIQNKNVQLVKVATPTFLSLVGLFQLERYSMQSDKKGPAWELCLLLQPHPIWLFCRCHLFHDLNGNIDSHGCAAIFPRNTRSLLCHEDWEERKQPRPISSRHQHLKIVWKNSNILLCSLRPLLPLNCRRPWLKQQKGYTKIQQSPNRYILHGN